MATTIKEIQVYPAAYPQELEAVIREIERDLKSAKIKGKVTFNSEFDGNRYQCKIQVSSKVLSDLSKAYPEAY